ncbi:hypothetical protein QUB68_14805 [Microcoleus sp. A006_D1]|uniref:hypothetical protein n=1 Tax=Microcoleus sp. A006_D1 TaxID=3055267 RepID=UPI002FD1544F
MKQALSTGSPCQACKKNAGNTADREDSQLVGTGYKLVFLAATYKNLGDTEKALSLYHSRDRPGRPKPVQHHQSQSTQRYRRALPRTGRICPSHAAPCTSNRNTRSSQR